MKKEQEKEEAAQKWKKSAQLMEKLFKVQKKSETKQPEEESSNDSEKIVSLTQNFMPFQVKENMRLAPTTRSTLDKLRRDTLDKTLNNGESTPVLTYLSKIKRNSDYRPGKCASVSWQEEDDSQDIILIGKLLVKLIKKRLFNQKMSFEQTLKEKNINWNR